MLGSWGIKPAKGNTVKKQSIGAGGTRSFGQTLAAVAWSFSGLRRKSDFDQDVNSLNPVYVILAALAGVALFIAVLLSVATYVTR